MSFSGSEFVALNTTDYVALSGFHNKPIHIAARCTHIRKENTLEQIQLALLMHCLYLNYYNNKTRKKCTKKGRKRFCYTYVYFC